MQEIPLKLWSTILHGPPISRSIPSTSSLLMSSSLFSISSWTRIGISRPDWTRVRGRRLGHVSVRAPLNIVQVGKSWREVALETPSLWIQIGPSSAPFIHTFLARSRSELLNIFWEPTKLPGPTDASQPAEIMQSCSSSLFRITYIV
ncbi:hypothetical protein BOTBODRAFT_487214 [Botryobasidium botryosum FD-172 SS1]|uniref:Uncharacterized protein n=1 Tax=Botryobasidium botryosum (strain FD-172 SS1) TaxID=930990 RepID=A0A067MFJ3_BOTB1|nr:hypothetical protein BOTBODRAFT_487214 [Botryobasidium botryosum FD-172 SS1]